MPAAFLCGDRENGTNPIETRRIQEHAARNPFSRFYYSTSRNTVLHCSTMFEAQWAPI
jgi:hypothetical protein